MVHALPELHMTFADRGALLQEIETNLKHGRAFVAGASGLSALDDCCLVLVHPCGAEPLRLAAQAVFVGDTGAMIGIGIQLRPFNHDVIAKLVEFGAQADAPAAEAEPTEDAESAQDAEPAQEPEATEAGDESTEGDDLAGEGESLDGDDDDASGDLQRQRPRQERLRKLNQTEQIKLARKADLNDRIMLERLYGKGVWDALLHNPKLTVPEVAQIARKGSVPRPLIELIVENNAWIQSPLVRRALLTNPRVSGEAIMKLLRLTPKHELRLIYKTTTYSNQVREAAKKVLEL